MSLQITDKHYLFKVNKFIIGSGFLQYVLSTQNSISQRCDSYYKRVAIYSTFVLQPCDSFYKRVPVAILIILRPVSILKLTVA